MDQLNIRLRALFGRAHDLGPEWFENAWEGGVTTTSRTAILLRVLLFNKKEAEKRLGNENVAGIFREELKLFREEILRREAIKEHARKATAPILSAPFALVRQEPVGHGCFHTGVLGTHTPLLRWVYDCGSWTKKEILKNRVDQFAARLSQDRFRDTDIDLLFVSHFDADHVSGLDYLLSRTRTSPVRVHTAVIPYMSPAASFAILARAASEDNCTAELIEIVYRPIRFFAARNVERVIFQKPKRFDEGDYSADSRLDPPAPPRGVPPIPGAPDVLTPTFINQDGKQLAEQTDSQSKIVTADAEYGTVCGVAADGAWADWWFLPYAYEWCENHAELIQVAKEIIGLAPDEAGFYERLPEQLQSKEGIKRVKSMFATLNSNETSLSLYAGSNARQSGWLLTGDAKLKTRARLEEWKNTFRCTSGFTSYLMIPHHGSDDNFNADLLTFAKGASHFVTVNAQDDEYGERPPATVRDEFKNAKKNFHVVSEQEESRITEVSGPDGLDDEDWRIDILDW